MHRTIRCLLATGLFPALVALAANPAAAQTREYDSLFAGRTIAFELPAETARAKSLLAQGNSRIDPGIRSLIAQGSGLGAAGFGALAKDLTVPLGARRSVAVALTPERGASVHDLIDRAGEHGAAVSFVFDDVVLAHVPLDGVHELGDSEELYYMNRQAELKPAYPALAAGAAAADGVRSVRAARLHAEGITGKGVRVGILDFGFERYRELQGRGLLPAPLAARAFNEAGTVESGGVHGTACAEIVHAMAPDAGIYLAADDGREDQIIEAAFWLAGQGIGTPELLRRQPCRPAQRAVAARQTRREDHGERHPLSQRRRERRRHALAGQGDGPQRRRLDRNRPRGGEFHGDPTGGRRPDIGGLGRLGFECTEAGLHTGHRRVPISLQLEQAKGPSDGQVRQPVQRAGVGHSGQLLVRADHVRRNPHATGPLGKTLSKRIEQRHVGLRRLRAPSRPPVTGLSRG